MTEPSRELVTSTASKTTRLVFAIFAVPLFLALLDVFLNVLVGGPGVLLVSAGAPDVVRTIWSVLGSLCSVALAVWVLVRLWRALANATQGRAPSSSTSAGSL